MTIRVSSFSKGTLATIVGGCAGDVVVQDVYYDVASGQNVLNDIIDIGILPANHTISDAILFPDDLDSNGTPLCALDVGIMSGTPGDAVSARTCGAEIFAASTAAQTGSVVRPTLKSAITILPSNIDRSIGVKFQAAAATAVAGRIRLRLFMHSTPFSQQF